MSFNQLYPEEIKAAREIKDYIKRNAKRKVIFLIGDSKVGKTTVSKFIAEEFEKCKYIDLSQLLKKDKKILDYFKRRKVLKSRSNSLIKKIIRKHKEELEADSFVLIFDNIKTNIANGFPENYNFGKNFEFLSRNGSIVWVLDKNHTDRFKELEKHDAWIVEIQAPSKKTIEDYCKKYNLKDNFDPRKKNYFPNRRIDYDN